MRHFPARVPSSGTRAHPLLIVALAALAGCSAEDPLLDALANEELRAGTGEPGGFDESEFCEAELFAPAPELYPQDQQLVFLDPQIPSCVDVGGEGGKWKLTPLFDHQAPHMRRFCHATWAPNTEAEPDTAALDTLGAHDADLPIVTGEGSDWADTVNPALSEVFRDHVDHLVNPDGLVPAPAHAVDVLVVDNLHPIIPNAHSIHGTVISEIVEDIICDEDPNCLRNVIPVLAMTEYYDGQGDVQTDLAGGSFGRLSIVSRAIEDTLDHVLAAEDERVVVNFSGGWNLIDDALPVTPQIQADLVAGNSLPDLDIGGLAVHASLIALRCAGALPIVAVGNQTARSCEEGPKYPGAWEQLPALTRDECVSLGFEVGDKSRPSHDSSGAYAPLIYAVGGVGYNDLPLGTARPGSTPRIVAPGQHGVGLTNGLPSSALAGTSVSAAVVSGAAALAWSYAPHITASRLMDLIYDQATPLVDAHGDPWEVDYSLGQGFYVRRVGACQAVTSVCSAEGLACNLNCDPGAPDLTPLTNILHGGSLPGPMPAPALEPIVCEDACEGQGITVWVPPGAQSAPPITLPALTYIPDPSDPSCASCELEFPDFNLPSGNAVLSLDDAYDSYTQEATWIDLHYADGSSSSELVTVVLSSTNPQVVTIVADHAPGAVMPVRGSVRMQLEIDGRSMIRTSPLPLIFPTNP